MKTGCRSQGGQMKTVCRSQGGQMKTGCRSQGGQSKMKVVLSKPLTYEDSGNMPICYYIIIT